MKEVTLPSGAILKIGHIPFDPANNLKKAVLSEFPTRSFTSVTDLMSAAMCTIFSSDRVEAALWECMSRCQYSDKRGELKIDKSTFEPQESREDFVLVQMSVGEHCLAPFGKGLYVALHRLLDLVAENTQK